MDIIRNGTRASGTAPEAYFTGTVRFDPVIDARAPSTVHALKVTFEPGARTAWHTHPLGQTLLVLSGVGRVQMWGGPIETINPGDTVWIPPGEKHWHGASANVAMCHLALQQEQDGSAADWMEHVTDAQYAGG